MVEFRISSRFSTFFPWLQSAKSFHFLTGDKGSNFSGKSEKGSGIKEMLVNNFYKKVLMS